MHTESAPDQEQKRTGERPFERAPAVSLASVAALVLAVSFWMPWLKGVFGVVTVSGYQLSQMDRSHVVLWAIPVCGVLSFFGSFMKNSRGAGAQITGALPYCGLLWLLSEEGSNAFSMLHAGAYLALVAGLLLLVSPYLRRPSSP